MVAAEAVVSGLASDLQLDQVPSRPGLYLLIERAKVLYVGECQSLRKRIAKHLDHSDNKGLAHWLWEHGMTDVHLEYHVLPARTSSRIRKKL